MPDAVQPPYPDLIVERSEAQRRLVPQYDGPDGHFDVVIVGSGIGGGILADALADALAPEDQRRILVLEAGPYLFPTHVYNIARVHNAELARTYAVTTFWQHGGERDQHYIHEELQLNLGGRSIFWSGLVPKLQDWELDFFPEEVRDDLRAHLAAADVVLNTSESLGRKAEDIVERLRATPLAADFVIEQTPRALHQPYLTATGTPRDEHWIEPTGVFNTAELLINELRNQPAERRRLHLLLNHPVDAVDRAGGHFVVRASDLGEGRSRTFTADVVVLAAGALESPKLLRRSPVFDHVTAKDLVGRGLTDHPTTDDVRATVTHIGDLPIGRNDHAKIVLYSKGQRDEDGRIRYPFNVEINVNHEYWHLRENDPEDAPTPPRGEHEAIVDMKFSFGNPLDDGNAVVFDSTAGPNLPEVRFKNLHWVDHLAHDRFPALAGWEKGFDEIWAVLDDVARRVFAEFRHDGRTVAPGGRYGQDGRDFGYGTVHHAVGTLRMPWKRAYDSPGFEEVSVVDGDLQVHGCPGLYVCDMSVLPYAAAANPVRALAALALRLADHLATP